MSIGRQRQHGSTASPVQVWETNTRTAPIQHDKTLRTERISAVTSSFGGKLVPLKMIPLLREDGVTNGSVQINVQMAETANMLLNPVRISAAAYLVPRLAFERFQDMGQIDRSYNGQNEVDGQPIPWFNTFTPGLAGSRTELVKTLGLHFKDGKSYNSDFVEAYNAVWNHIAANRSPDLPQRANTEQTLAPAFWQNTQLKHVKAKFDDALMDGKIELNPINEVLAPVRGIGLAGQSYPGTNQSAYEGGGVNRTYGSFSTHNASTANNSIVIEQDPDNTGYPNVYAEISQALSGSISLADIDQARATAAWARLRTQFQGKSDDWMIDQLLQGIRLNDDNLKQPILIGSNETIVGMSQRFASDSANLTKSVVDGRTSVTMNFRTPAVPCGGVIVIVAQALPEQIFERFEDNYLECTDVTQLPNRTADELDPQPVEMLANESVDCYHSVPLGLFGYAPLNHRWQRSNPTVGGKYYRDDPAAAWTEDRNRIWDSNVIDPALGSDFYLATTFQHNVFETSNSDPFEWWCTGAAQIRGLTYFGPGLREGRDDYDKVIGQTDSTRLKGDGTDQPS